MALVTVEQVNNALRLGLELDLGDPSGEEANLSRLADVELKIRQAEAIVIDYLKSPDHEWTEETVPGQVSAAILLVIKSLFDDSAKAEMLKGLAGNDLSNPVVGLLYRSRDPALA